MPSPCACHLRRYGHVLPGESRPLEALGRLSFDGVDSERTCCQLAMAYEGMPSSEGGAAVRFGISHDGGAPRCLVDREAMLNGPDWHAQNLTTHPSLDEPQRVAPLRLVTCRAVVPCQTATLAGNLDASSGHAANALEACGAGFYFWRHAAGAADGSDLKGGSRCAREGGFTRVRSRGVGLPTGRLPLGHTLPSRPCSADPSNCGHAIVYNTINVAEDCCAACVRLRWLGGDAVGGDADEEGNPCLAWQVSLPYDGSGSACHFQPTACRCHPVSQIVDGKCHVLRKAWFDTKYGATGLGQSDVGSAPMAVGAVIGACAGFRDEAACMRADDSQVTKSNFHPSAVSLSYPDALRALICSRRARWSPTLCRASGPTASHRRQTARTTAPTTRRCTGASRRMRRALPLQSSRTTARRTSPLSPPQLTPQ